MAVITSKNASTLKVKYDCGIDIFGDAIVKTSNYTNIKPTASNEALMEVVNALTSLQKHNLGGVTKVDSTALSE